MRTHSISLTAAAPALVILVAAGVIAAGVWAAGVWAAESPKPAPAPPAAVSDAQLSLYPGSLFEVPNPPGFAWNNNDPGGNERLPRPYPTAPPRIPHAIVDSLPITLTSNLCLECHALGADVGAPELPASHRTDLRRAPGTVLEAVAGARWVCTSCHVPTSNAPALRANSASPP